MIKVITLPTEALEEIRKKTATGYWGIALQMCIVVVVLGFLFSEWFIGIFTALFILILFFIATLLGGKQQQPIRGNRKIIRKGIVTDARLQRMGYRVRHKTITITLEEEALPEGCPVIHSFTIYHSWGNIAYKQDEQLPAYYKQLPGRTVEIEYMAESGFVLGFRAAPPFLL